jgi:hypothetical protein
LLDDPDPTVAMNLLGVIAHQFLKYEVAYNLTSYILLIDPTNTEAYNYLGLMLLEQGKQMRQYSVTAKPFF